MIVRPGMVGAIVTARQQRPFISVQDCVVRIKGFGQKKITKLSQHGVSIPDVTCPLTVK